MASVHFNKTLQNDFLMKSPIVGQEEQIVTSFDDGRGGGGGTEISSNAQFIEDVFEGDIVLTVPQARSLLQESNRRQKRKVMRDLIGRWPTKNINYSFDSTISKSTLNCTRKFQRKTVYVHNSNRFNNPKRLHSFF